MDTLTNHPSDCPRRAESGEPAEIGALTRRMAAGDEAAYRQFYDAYFNRLSRYLLVVTHGNEDAMREALQATLVRVVRHIKAFQTEAAFWSWLTVLARSSAFDHGRKHRRYFAFLDRFTQHAAAEQSAPADPPGDEQMRLLLERHVLLLPPDERQLVDWKYFRRRSVREMARELETSEKAVESKLSRVRRKLKDAVLAELKNESRT